MASILACPVCGSPLQQFEGQYQCINRHSYDVSRDGYVNLLLANQKASKLPGDSREMLQSRRRFLESGHFHMLSNRLNQLINQHLQPQISFPKPIAVLEAGCGEGYYIGELQQFLDTLLSPHAIDYWGLDIAKDAIRMAARRYPRINFLVASTRRKMPMMDQSVDVLLTIFAPRNAAEFQRIMVSRGILIIVIPGKNHLSQLRTVLQLPERESSKQDEVIADFVNDFTVDGFEKLNVTIILDNEALLDLIKMTPNYWHITADTWERLNDLDHFETQIEFVILIFHRR